MIDVVRAEAKPDHLLDQISFFVGTLGGPKAGQSFAAVPVADLDQPGCGPVEGFFPGRLVEVGVRV